MRVVLIGLMLLTTAACSAGAYSTEVKGLAAAGGVLVQAPVGYVKAQGELRRQALDDDLLDSLLAGDRFESATDCIAGIRSVRDDYLGLSRNDTQGQNAAFDRFAQLQVCELGTADLANDPEPAVSPTRARVMRELATYLSALENIAGGETVTEVDQALVEARAAGRGLAETVAEGSAVAPASDLFFTLFSFQLERRRYVALRDAVRSFDPAWRAAAPDIGISLRTSHLRLLSARSSAASDTRLRMENALNRVRASPAADQMAVFNAWSERLGARNAALRAALDADPADTVSNFTVAHGKLLEALEDTDRQTEGVLEAIAELITSASALEAALEGEGQ